MQNKINQHVADQPFTSEELSNLTPDDVFHILKQGNKEYAEGHLTVRNNLKRIRESVWGQQPYAVVVSCMDSRVPVEDIFHRGIGDMFVVRIAGNIINEDILGCLEIACKVFGAKLVVILGHEQCGAIQSAIDGVKLGHIAPVLANIQPAVDSAGAIFNGNKTSSNPAFVDAVCRQHVKHAMDIIRAKSPILKEMEEKGAIKIVGGIYQIGTGRVDFWTAN